MELDRNAIERSDFAQARRGYDPDEVDAHLAQVAAAFEQLKARPTPAAATMAGAAADQVRTIVEAAERTAHEIQAGAQTEADRAMADAKRQADEDRASARTEAEESRERAETAAEGHVTSVRDATAELRARAESMQSDLNGMVEKLRESIDAIVDSARSNASSLENELHAYQQSHDPPAAEPEQGTPPETGPPLVVAEPTPLSVDEPEAEEIEEVAVAGLEPDTDEEDALEAVAEPATAYDEELLDEPVAEAGEEPIAEPDLTHEEPVMPPDPEPEQLVRGPVISPEPEPEPEPEPAAGAPAAGGGGDGAEGARLIALNMALNGTPREETSRYLEENFDLENRETILDDVYSRVGG